jgi:hypothetical protein
LPRRPIEQHGAAGVQRRAALLDDFLGNREVAEGFPNALIRHQLVGQLLHVDLLVELIQSYRRRSRVTHLRQRVHHPPASAVGEGITHVQRIAGLARTQGAQQLPVNRHLHQLHHDVVRQLDGRDELAQRLQMIDVNQLTSRLSRSVGSSFVAAMSLGSAGMRFRKESSVSCEMHPELTSRSPALANWRRMP